jgi:hypothetical protein
MSAAPICLLETSSKNPLDAATGRQGEVSVRRIGLDRHDAGAIVSEVDAARHPRRAQERQ